MKNRVLITGATGFVGANLARRLVKEGYDVHILTRKTSNKWRLFNVLSRLHDHIVDLREDTKLKKIIIKIKPNIIFHLATSGIYGGRHLAEKELIEINLLGTINLINACNDLDYKCFINTGSSSEYGPKDNPMRESDICGPINVYGITKLASTLYCNFIAKTDNKPIVTFRLFSPFGPYDDRSKLMTYAIINALQNKELSLANPDAVRDYVYIDDVLDLYIKCIDKVEEFKGEVFNVGRGSQTKISYVVNKVLELTNSTSLIKWNAVLPRSFDTKRWEADINKTCKYFNWKPRYSVDRGLEKTTTWFENNLSLYKNDV
jgi:nucleoside-diphosphate-sugar epimerase